MQEFRLSPHEHIRILPPQPIRIFLGGELLPQKPDTKNISEYMRLGGIYLTTMRIASVKSETVQYIGLTNPLRGMELNALTHYGAPNKSYGFDTSDYLQDERTLFNPTSESGEKRLHDHRQIRNWDKFERIRKRCTRVIDLDYGSDKVENPPKLVPVIQISMDKGVMRFDFDLNPELACRIQNRDLYTMDDLDENPLMAELGPLLAAAFSPDVTS